MHFNVGSPFWATSKGPDGGSCFCIFLLKICKRALFFAGVGAFFCAINRGGGIFGGIFRNQCGSFGKTSWSCIILWLCFIFAVLIFPQLKFLSNLFVSTAGYLQNVRTSTASHKGGPFIAEGRKAFFHVCFSDLMKLKLVVSPPNPRGVLLFILSLLFLFESDSTPNGGRHMHRSRVFLKPRGPAIQPAGSSPKKFMQSGEHFFWTVTLKMMVHLTQSQQTPLEPW